GLMILRNIPAFYYGTSPNKFFDYLASGLPVLVNYPGWMADMITAQGAGVVVPPNDPMAFAEAVIGLADSPVMMAEMARRCVNLARREFLQMDLAQRCVSVIEKAAGMSQGRRISLYRRWGKRAFDLLAVILALPFLLPIAVVVSVLIRLQMGSPVFFRQQRPGFRARPFTLLKFRTMTFASNESGTLLCDENRLSSLGKQLRRWSIDEIPQVWNVIKGEMSLV